MRKELCSIYYLILRAPQRTKCGGLAPDSAVLTATKQPFHNAGLSAVRAVVPALWKEKQKDPDSCQTLSPKENKPGLAAKTLARKACTRAEVEGENLFHKDWSRILHMCVPTTHTPIDSHYDAGNLL